MGWEWERCFVWGHYCWCLEAFVCACVYVRDKGDAWWADGWVGEWTGKWIGRYGLVGGWVDRWVSGWMGEWKDGWVDGWVVEWMDEWVGGDSMVLMRTYWIIKSGYVRGIINNVRILYYIIWYYIILYYIILYYIIYRSRTTIARKPPLVARANDFSR